MSWNCIETSAKDEFTPEQVVEKDESSDGCGAAEQRVKIDAAIIPVDLMQVKSQTQVSCLLQLGLLAQGKRNQIPSTDQCYQLFPR